MTTYYISDCCCASIFYNDDDVLTCTACGEECEVVRLPPDKNEIAIVKAEGREDR